MITIEGYSGCGIRVFRNPDPQSTDYILEKSTDSSSYVPRLLLQADKQAAFARFNKLPNVTVPTIMYTRKETVTEYSGSGGKEKPLRCAIGMNFLHHVDAISFLAKASIHEVRGFSMVLIDLVQQYVDASPLADVSASVFVNKLEDVRRICRGNSFMDSDDRDFMCDVVMERLIRSLCDEQGKPRQIRLPLGLCHGDLTLSNILVVPDDNYPATSTTVSATGSGSDAAAGVAVPSAPLPRISIVLIDFLDSFVETPLADLAKLFQDVKYAWTIRVSPQHSNLDMIHFFSILAFLRNQLEASFGKEAWFQEHFSLTFVLNQLRVLQYSKDRGAAKYLVGTVRQEFECWEQRAEGRR